MRYVSTVQNPLWTVCTVQTCQWTALYMCALGRCAHNVRDADVSFTTCLLSCLVNHNATGIGAEQYYQAVQRETRSKRSKRIYTLNGRFSITGAATCRLAAFFCFVDLFVSCRPEAIDDSALASAAARCAQCTACSLLVARSVQGLALKTCAGGEVHITACVHDDASADVTCTI